MQQPPATLEERTLPAHRNQVLADTGPTPEDSESERLRRCTPVKAINYCHHLLDTAGIPESLWGGIETYVLMDPSMLHEDDDPDERPVYDRRQLTCRLGEIARAFAVCFTPLGTSKGNTKRTMRRCFVYFRKTDIPSEFRRGLIVGLVSERKALAVGNPHYNGMPRLPDVITLLNKRFQYLLENRRPLPNNQ